MLRSRCCSLRKHLKMSDCSAVGGLLVQRHRPLWICQWSLSLLVDLEPSPTLIGGTSLICFGTMRDVTRHRCACYGCWCRCLGRMKRDWTAHHKGGEEEREAANTCFPRVDLLAPTCTWRTLRRIQHGVFLLWLQLFFSLKSFTRPGSFKKRSVFVKIQEKFPPSPGAPQ